MSDPATDERDGIACVLIAVAFLAVVLYLTFVSDQQFLR